MADCEEIKQITLKKKGKGRERNWKDEEIEMLITLYEQRPCLWDLVCGTWSVGLGLWDLVCGTWSVLITLYEQRPSLWAWSVGLVCGTWSASHKDYMNRDNLYLGLSFGLLHLRRPNKLLFAGWTSCFDTFLHLPMSSRRVGGGGWGGEAGHRAFELSCCPGGRDIWIFFVPMTTNHYPGWGISVIFHLTFIPRGREFDINFLENVKIPPYACVAYLSRA